MTERLFRTKTKAAPGIVHFGPGAFFRAFNAVYTHEAMEAAGGDWGIVAVSLKSTGARDKLAPQDFCYSSVTMSENGFLSQTINSISDVMVATMAPEAVVRVMTDPAIRIVSLTITEKGYGYDFSSGGLDTSHPDVAHDLNTPDVPKSAVGFIVAALNARRRAGIPPFTVLSCDNLPANGQVTRAVTVEYAQRTQPNLADWIAAYVNFPSTMVDRITPATTNDKIEALSRDIGVADHAAVFHERFRQWVIEDDFAFGRPAWDLVGAQMVSDVSKHEEMKLRCLNGTHSALAYLGFLAGHETVADAVSDWRFAALCESLWQDEILPTIATPEGEQPERYCESLLTRFNDHSLRHQLSQIAMDGSQKLPQRILATVRDRLSAGKSPQGLCLVVAAWMRYVCGRDERGNTIDVRDPLADRMTELTAGEQTPAETVDALLQIEDVFGRDLATNSVFRETIIHWFDLLCRLGAAAAVEAYVSSQPDFQGNKAIKDFPI